MFLCSESQIESKDATANVKRNGNRSSGQKGISIDFNGIFYMTFT